MLIAAIFWGACGSEHTRDKDFDRIRSMMHSDSMAVSNDRGAYMDSLITLCEAFVKSYPNDTAADFILLQTTNFQITQQRYRLALLQIDKLEKIYPNSKYLPAAGYLKGDIYNTFLNNPSEAIKIWDEVIRKFPGDLWANQAKQMKDLAGMSPEDMLKSIMQKRDSSEKRN